MKRKFLSMALAAVLATTMLNVPVTAYADAGKATLEDMADKENPTGLINGQGTTIGEKQSIDVTSKEVGNEHKIIYFGPMGCRTGFYFLVRDMKPEDAIALIQRIMTDIANYEGEIPGNTAVECGNYLEHDLEDAKNQAKEFLPYIANWTVEQLKYE